jgi:hypothetical protein
MRITALEKEVARHKAQLETEPSRTHAECTPQELLQKIDMLEKVCAPDTQPRCYANLTSKTEF